MKFRRLSPPNDSSNLTLIPSPSSEGEGGAVAILVSCFEVRSPLLISKERGRGEV